MPTLRTDGPAGALESVVPRGTPAGAVVDVGWGSGGSRHTEGRAYPRIQKPSNSAPGGPPLSRLDVPAGHST